MATLAQISLKRGVVVALGTALLAGEVEAGANADARAFLSWSSDSRMLDTVPGENGDVVLYLRVEGARQVAHLTNEILWSADVPNGAELIWPDPREQEGGTCGVTNGNPERRGQVAFATPPGGNFCVAMRLRVDPPSADLGVRFRPGLVRLEDSGGNFDVLEIEETGVTLNGGGQAGFSFLVTAIEGRTPVAGGFADTLSVVGLGFEGGTTVTLRSETSGRSLAGTILSRNWSSLAVEVTPGTSDAGMWRAVVEHPAGIGYADSSQSLEILPPPDGPRTWRVPQDFPTVQAALDAAAPGDTVDVAAGIYDGEHAWILGKDRIVLKGAGADKTVIRAVRDTVFGISRASDVEVFGISFIVDNSDHRTRVPVILGEASCRIALCTFMFTNCDVCTYIVQPRGLVFENNTVVRRGDGSNLFARVTPREEDGSDLLGAIEIRQLLSIGFDASFACETPVPIGAECNWDAGSRLTWFETESDQIPELESLELLDFRPIEGSFALPENNPCGLLIGAIGRGDF